MPDYNSIDVSQEGDVFRIAFDRPNNRNAFNSNVLEDMTHVFDDAAESDARVVLLTGNGDSFAAGGDIEAMQHIIDHGSEEGAQVPGVDYDSFDTSSFGEAFTDVKAFFEGLMDLRKPTIAKVNGDAVGAGATVALFCDIVIASEDARIGDPHVSVGLAAPAGPMLWPLLTDHHKAKELLMTGDLVSGTEAKELGLVNYAVPPEELDEKVDEMIEKLATGSQPAIQFTKVTANGWLQMAANSMFHEGLLFEAITQSNKDHEEAVDAFLNKRTPNFPSGRDPSE